MNSATATKLSTGEKAFFLSLAALTVFTAIGTSAPETSKQTLLDAGYTDVKITDKASLLKCLTPIRPTFTAVASGQKISGYMCGPTSFHNLHPSIIVEKREPLTP